MLRFESDYLEGALPEIMEALQRTNLEQTPGYGEDAHCENAARLIREKCRAPEAAVHFLVGGTQANLTVIAAALRPHQAVMAADTGHIAVHETGSVEATGHKVIALPSPDGKINAEQIKIASRPTGRTRRTSTSPSPRWCTSPSLRKTARSTPSRSWRR